MNEFVTTPSPIVFPYTGAELGEMITIIPNLYGRIRTSGMFVPRPMAMTMVRITYEEGRIKLLPATQRGAAPSAQGGKTGKTVFIDIPHIPHIEHITPDDIQNRTSPEDPSRPITLDEVLQEKLEDIRVRHDQTHEFMHMGALKGRIYDGAGNLLIDLYDTLGITEKVINFKLNVASTNVRNKCSELRRHLEKSLRGEIMNGIRVQVDPTFMDMLTAHPNVEKFWLNHAAAMDYSQGDLRMFPFGGIVFEEYLASGTLHDDSEVQFIEEGSGHAYPMGTRKTFRFYSGPPYDIRAVNRAPGQDVYISPKELDHGKGIELHSESDPLPICERPDLLVRLEAE